MVGVESFCAIYLLIGPSFRAWQLAIGLFSCLTVSALLAITFNRDCNCFGSDVSAQTMLIVDFSALGLLAVTRRNATAVSATQHSRKAVVVAFILAISSSLIAAWQVARPSANLEYLSATELLHQSWPLNSEVHPQLKALESDRWLVLIVRPDCAHCSELLAKFFVDPQRHRYQERTAVFIATQSTWLFGLDSVLPATDRQHPIHFLETEPFVAAPAAFVLVDGQVIAASDGDQTATFLEAILGDDR